MKKILTILLLLTSTMSVFALSGDLDELDGKRLGVLTGTTFDIMTRERFPNAEYLYYNGLPDLTQALKDGKVDGFMFDEPVMRYIKIQDPTIDYYEEVITRDEYGYGFAKTDAGQRLKNDFDQFVREMRDSGELKALEDKWFVSDPSVYTVDYQSLPAINGKLVSAGECLNPPFEFVSNGKIIGFEVDVLYEYCKRRGYALEVINVDAASRISYLVSGKSDISFGCLTLTEERSRSIFFSETTYVGGTVMAVLAEGAAPVAKPGFFESVAESFRRNFIEEERYKMVFSGLLVTVRISVFSALFGTILGFGLCMQRRMKNRFLSNLAVVFTRVIQGLPLVVFLMILYYIVFKKSRMSAEIVAIIGFAINFGAYVSEMMKSGIEAVDKGQIEAALSMGFNPCRTFMKITLPQASRHFFPVYKGEFISMVKMTSVVGYIAIQDITKVSDIIRSRTFDAFFPLICTALLYFIVAYVFIFLLHRLELRLEPRRNAK